MVFSSFTFFLFFCLFWVGYWVLNQRASLRWLNLYTLAASYLFYGWWDWRFLSLIFISSLADFLLGKALYAENHSHRRKLILGASLAINLGILGFFKYFNFFAGSFIDLVNLLGWSADPFTLEIILPVGISFYTFQTLSYTIDIFRKKQAPTEDPVAFFTFVSFFPQLAAGPIERAAHLLPQFRQKRVFHRMDAVAGLRLVLWGLFKKVVIADRLGVYVQEVFGNHAEVSGWGVIIGVVAFSFQVYGDFSGYSDMAIGMARLLGIRLMTNFRTPFFATSIHSFWNRWHISLSTWFRDYVYIPLGGNRKGPIRWAGAIVVTFLVSGLWHGASYNFVIWGLFLGIFYLVEAFLLRKLHLPFSLPSFLKTAYVFGYFSLSMLLFRAENLEVVRGLLSQLGNWQEMSPAISVLYQSPTEGVVLLCAFLLFLGIDLLIGKKDPDLALGSLPGYLRWGLYYLLTAGLILLADLSEAPEFIYFQF